MTEKKDYEDVLYEFISDLKPEVWNIICEAIKENKGKMSLQEAFENYLPIFGIEAFRNPKKYTKQ